MTKRTNDSQYMSQNLLTAQYSYKNLILQEESYNDWKKAKNLFQLLISCGGDHQFQPQPLGSSYQGQNSSTSGIRLNQRILYSQNLQIIYFNAPEMSEWPDISYEKSCSQYHLQQQMDEQPSYYNIQQAYVDQDQYRSIFQLNPHAEQAQDIIDQSQESQSSNQNNTDQSVITNQDFL